MFGYGNYDLADRHARRTQLSRHATMSAATVSPPPTSMSAAQVMFTLAVRNAARDATASSDYARAADRTPSLQARQRTIDDEAGSRRCRPRRSPMQRWTQADGRQDPPAGHRPLRPLHPRRHGPPRFHGRDGQDRRQRRRRRTADRRHRRLSRRRRASVAREAILTSRHARRRLPAATRPMSPSRAPARSKRPCW